MKLITNDKRVAELEGRISALRDAIALLIDLFDDDNDGIITSYVTQCIDNRDDLAFFFGD